MTAIEHIAPNGAHYFRHADMDRDEAISYGFFSRQGGVSDGLYAGLNGGLGSDDTPQHVAQNRALAASAFGGTPLPIASLFQIHSAHCVTINSPPTAQIANRPRADAMVTTMTEILLLLLTADCLPVFFIDKTHGVIGAAHAGWRGAVAGILESTTAAMCNAGARRSDITAIIGPAIRQPHYQIGEDMADQIARHHKGAETCLLADDSASDTRYLFDLPRFAEQILQQQQIGRVLDVGLDTYADSDRFYSHRWATHQKLPDSGRLISAISLRRMIQE